MNFGFNPDENSTRLGIFIGVVTVAGIAGWWTGKDLTGLLSLGTFVASFVGIAIKDK